MNFSGEKAVSFFKYSNYIFTIVPKIMKKYYAIPEENAELTDGWTDRQKDSQTTMILQDPLQDGDPITKVTLSFPEFISKHQKSVYYINFFVRYNQFQISVTRVGLPIYDHAHPNIFQSTFNFDEFVSTCKKIRLFHLFVLEILFKNPQSDWPKTHISGTKLFQDFSKHTAININFYYRPN